MLRLKLSYAALRAAALDSSIQISAEQLPREVELHSHRVVAVFEGSKPSREFQDFAALRKFYGGAIEIDLGSVKYVDPESKLHFPLQVSKIG